MGEALLGPFTAEAEEEAKKVKEWQIKEITRNYHPAEINMRTSQTTTTRP